MQLQRSDRSTTTATTPTRRSPSSRDLWRLPWIPTPSASARSWRPSCLPPAAGGGAVRRRRSTPTAASRSARWATLASSPAAARASSPTEPISPPPPPPSSSKARATPPHSSSCVSGPQWRLFLPETATVPRRVLFCVMPCVWTGCE